MSKYTKKIIQVLMILCVAVVTAAGLYWFGYFTQHTPGPKQFIVKEIPVDPETIIDPYLDRNGINYEDSKDADGNLAFNSDGSITRTIYGADKFYLDDKDYKEIDTTIVETAGEFEYENTTNTLKSYFDRSQGENEIVKVNIPGSDYDYEAAKLENQVPTKIGEEGQVEIDFDELSKLDEDGDGIVDFDLNPPEISVDRTISFSIVGARESIPVVEENKITYPDILEGLDARYTTVENIILEEFIAEEKPSIDRISEKVNLSRVYYKEQVDGSITFHDIYSKNLVFEIPPPVMYELRDDEEIKAAAASYDLHYELEEIDGELIITKVIDEAGLAWLDVVTYPVAIDNTIVVAGAGETLQGWIDENAVGGNYAAVDEVGYFGENRIFEASWGDANDEYHRALLTFDTGTTPPPGTVVGGKLILNMFGTSCYRSGYGRSFQPLEDEDEGADLDVYSAKDLWVATDFTTGRVGLRDKTTPGAPGLTDIGEIDTTPYIDHQFDGGGECNPNSYSEQTPWPQPPGIPIGHLCADSCRDTYCCINSPLNRGCPSWDGRLSTCWADFARYANCSGGLCQREHIITNTNIFNFSGNGHTNFIFDPEQFPITGGRTGVFIYGQNAVYGTSMSPSLEIYYLPKPDIEIHTQGTNYITVRVNDNTNDERNWYLEYRDPGGVWTFLRTITPGNTGTTGTPSQPGYISWDCSGVSQAGTSGYCTVQHYVNLPNGDKRVEYRARITHDVTGNQSEWSDTIEGWSIPHPPSSANAVVGTNNNNNYWDKFRLILPSGDTPVDSEWGNQKSYPVYGGPDPEPTQYCVGVYAVDWWVSSPTTRFSFIPGSSGATTGVHEPNGGSFMAEIISDARCRTLYNWIWSPYLGDYYIGFENGTTVKLKPDTVYYPFVAARTSDSSWNRVYWDLTAMIASETYTRARLPSAPEDMSISHDRMTIRQNHVPESEPAWTNPRATTSLEYAMQRCTDADANNICDDAWRYLYPTGGSSTSLSPQWGDYSDWGSSTGRTFSGLLSSTCYLYRATSRNSVNIQGDGYDTFSSDNFTQYAQQYCTPLAPPDAPTISCDYDVDGTYVMEEVMQFYSGITDEILEQQEIKKPLFNIKVANARIIFEPPECGNGICEDPFETQLNCPADCAPPSTPLNDYYCDVDINDSSNLGVLYYNIQRRACAYPYAGCGSWINIDANGDDVGSPTWFSDTGTITNNPLDCGASNEYYEYQVRVSRDGFNGTNPSEFSPFGGDYMPPCQVDPAPIGSNETTQSITWGWTTPTYGAPVTGGGYYLYLQSPTSTQKINSSNTATSYIWPNTLTPNVNYKLDVAAYDSRGREGARSVQSASHVTLADNPTIDVTCGYSVVYNNYCRVRLSSHGLNNTAQYPPDYCLGRFDGTNWSYYNFRTLAWAQSATTTCNGLNNDYWDAANNFIAGTWEIYNRDLSCGTTYGYRMEARNDNNVVTTSPVAIIREDDTLPCPPENMGHSSNDYTSSTFRINWTWTNPVGNTFPINLYNSTDCTGTLLGTRGSGDTSFYYNYGTYSSHGNTQKTISACYDDGGNLGQPATASAYTAIQVPNAPSLSTVSTAPTEQIRVTRSGRLTNVNDQWNSVYYDYYSGNGGSGGNDSGWVNDGTNNTTGNWVDTGLDPNYQYCYRVRARNNQTVVPPHSTATGDETVNGAGSCIYTEAVIPNLPIRRRIDANTVNLIISDDDNPRVLGANDTRYAICVTEYGVDPDPTLEAYLQADGTLGPAGEDFCNSGVYNENSAVWRPRRDWGDTAGVNITGLDPSKKYGFSVKAANEENVATNFGPTATLFLVRNNVVGWAWSSNIGWVSMNCLNLFTEPSLGYSCDATEDWGINTNFEPTREINPLEGYAWAASGLQIHDWLTGNINGTGQAIFNLNYWINQKTELSLDAQGNPHIVWSEYDNTSGAYDIYYLRKINNVWQTADGTPYTPNTINPISTGLNVSNTSSPSLWASLDIDSNGNPHIAWNEGGWSEIEWAHQQVWYTYWNGTDWEVVSRVDTTDNGGSTPSLKLTSTDQPYVAYMNGWYNYGTDIFVRKLDTGVWTDVDGGADDQLNVSQSIFGQSGGGYSNAGSMYPDLEIDSLDNPHVAWRQTAMDGNDASTQEDTHIYYKKWNGSAWVSASNEDNTTNTVCSTDFNTPVACLPNTASEQTLCGWTCGEGAQNPGAACNDNSDCLGRCIDFGAWNYESPTRTCASDVDCINAPFTTCDKYYATCEHNQCVNENLSVNEDLYLLPTQIDNGTDLLDRIDAGRATMDMALYPDDTPGIIFNDDYHFVIFKRWDGSDWVDVDGGKDIDDLWINKNAAGEIRRYPTSYAQYAVNINSSGIPYIIWSDSEAGSDFKDVHVRKWDDIEGAWTTVSGVYGGAENYDDSQLLPYDIDYTYSRNTTLAADDEGNIHVAWGEITLDSQGPDTCAWDSPCTNPNYPKCYVEDRQCVRTCTTNADCTNGLYPYCISDNGGNVCGTSELIYSKWENEPNKSGLGWISFNKFVCANDTQQGCSVEIDPSDECGGAACVVSTDDPPGSISYGYCYQDNTASAKKYGVCSDDEITYCLEDNISTCTDPINSYCILETCKTGDTCSDLDGGPIVEDCRDTATANFSGSSREIEGWARILSAKEQGERYLPPINDWGWIRLGGIYDNGLGNSGEYNISGLEIDAQEFLGDPDVAADSLALYTILGWGWNADITNYNNLSEWLTPVNLTRTNSVHYDNSGWWKDLSMVVDIYGDIHMAWSEFNIQNSLYDIYYVKLSGGKWLTASGVEYSPTNPSFNSNTSNLDVSNSSGLVAAGFYSRFPSLALDNQGNPHIVGQVHNLPHGGDPSEGGTGIFYTYWNGTSWENYSMVENGASQTPSLALNETNIPYVLYKKGQYSPTQIYLKVWNGDAWNSISNDNTNFDVDMSPQTRSIMPQLKLVGNTPHVTWVDGSPNVSYLNSHIFYRWWNGSDWVTASGDAGPNVCSHDFNLACNIDADCLANCASSSDNPYIGCTQDSDCDNDGTELWADICITNLCVSQDLSVNWGLRECTGDGRACYDDGYCAAAGQGTCNGLAGGLPNGFFGEVPSIEVFSDGRPGIIYSDYSRIFFRRWDGATWTDVNGGDGLDNVRLNESDEYSVGSTSIDLDNDDQPHVSWTEEHSATPGEFDVRYLRWDSIAADWLTIDGNSANDFNTPNYNVSNNPSYQSFGASLKLDGWDNTHLSWIDTQKDPAGIECGDFSGNGIIDGIDGEIHDIALDEDNNAIYLVGVSEYDVGRGDHWRIDKRRYDNGELVSGFGWYENPADGLITSTVDWDNGIIIGDTHSRVAWNIELDTENNELYVVGQDYIGSHWRIEKRNMITGDRVAGFGNPDDTDWPDNPAGVVRTGVGDANLGVDLKIDDDYIYLTGLDDTGDIRIEKRLKTTGELVLNFGNQGVILSTSGADARKILIEENYMWIGGKDDSNNWRIEKRRLDTGELVIPFGIGGVFTGSAADPNTDSLYEMILDDDYLYLTGRTDGYQWLIGKLNKTSGILDTNFDTDGYLEINSRFSHGLATSGDNLIISGQVTGGTPVMWHTEIRNKNSGVLNPITVNNGWTNGQIDSVSGSVWVWGARTDDNYMYIYGNDSSNWRLERRWISSGVLDDHPNGISSLDCKNPDYPVCNWVWPGHECVNSNVKYSKWTPGNVQGGVGWIEFMPAGSLLGVPWVQTAFANIFGTGSVNLAPPPRGSGEYTATYLILSNGQIQGIPTNYSGNYSQDPTTQLYEFGLNPLIEGSSLPFGENALSKINVDALISDQGGNKNRYGHDIIELNDSQIDASQLGANPVLNNSVYYYNGDATIDSIITIEKGDATAGPPTAGDGLIVITGDLEINSNINYQKECSVSSNSCVVDADCPGEEVCENLQLTDVTEMQSLAFIVRGNIYISPFVTNLDSVFVALDNPLTTNISEGIINTSRQKPGVENVDLFDDNSGVVLAENDTYINNDGTGGYTAYDDDNELRFGQQNSIYGFRRKINIKDEPLITGNVNSFPLMVNINSGNVMWNSVTSPDEVAFTDANGIALDFHFEYFDDATNEAIAWVEVPTLTTDGSDYIYIYYDTATPINQEDEPGTYNDTFKAVYHLSDDDDHIGAGDINYVGHNSTQFSHDGTISSNDATGVFEGDEAIDALIGRGVYFDGHPGGSCDNPIYLTESDCTDNAGTWTSSPPTGDYIDLGPDILNGSGDHTIEAWVNIPPDPTPTGSNGWYDYTGTIVQQRDSRSNGHDGGYQIQAVDGWQGGTLAKYTSWYSGLTWNVEVWPPNIENNGWHHIVAVQDNSINGGILYVDGVEVGRDTINGVVNVFGDLYSFIGVDPYQSFGDSYQYDDYLLGSIDEVTMSDTARSSDWIRAAYENGNNNLIASWDGQEIIATTASLDRTYLRMAMGPNEELNIPPGSEIREAYLELTGSGSSFGDIDARIYLINEDDMPALDTYTAQNLYDVSVTNSISFSSAVADWDNSGVNRTPDIKSLINRFINTDKYAENYYNNDATHIGLVIQEDLSAIGGFREFWSSEHGNDSPKLIVEYSPRRKSFAISNNSDDANASSGGWSNVGCHNYGYYDDAGTFYRTYLRFPGIDLKTNVEVLNANIRAYSCNDSGNHGIEAFQLRQGLVENYPGTFVANPFNLTLDTATSEVAYDLSQNEMATTVTGTTLDQKITLPDIKKLVNVFLERNDYNPNDNNFNSLSIRLRGGGDSIESTLTTNQWRGIAGADIPGAITTLDIDYLSPLNISGLLVAHGFNFDRKYNKDLAPAERIVYDGRVLANTPPGLSDFTKTLPIYQRVAP